MLELGNSHDIYEGSEMQLIQNGSESWRLIRTGGGEGGEPRAEPPPQQVGGGEPSSPNPAEKMAERQKCSSPGNGAG